MDIWMDVDTALSEVPINLLPLIDDGDFKAREESVVYNQAGLDLLWNFVTTAGGFTQTAVTPTDTGGNYDWVNQGNGMYTIEIPASGGASINNDTEGFGWFTGYATGILPWRGPVIGFRAAGLNNVLVDSAYSATRGLAGTALPDAAADAAGGLPVSATGGLALDDIPITSEFEARTLPSADYTIVSDLGTVQSGDSYAIVNGDHGLVSIQDDVDAILEDTGTTLPTAVADVPTVAEFNARSIPSADYVVVGDTIAGVTLVTTCTTNSDMRGTNSAALASVCTETRLSELDAGTAGKMANQVDVIQTDTTTDIPTLIADVPTVSEFNARTLPAADYTVVSDLPSEPPTVGEIRTEMETNGGKLDHLWETTEDDTGVRRFTANALEQAPSGTSLDAAGIRSAVGLAAANLDTQLADLPTVAEVEARSLPSADYVVVSDLPSEPPSAADIKTEIEGVGSSIAQILEDTDELQTNQGDWLTAEGFSTHSAADVKTSLEADGSKLDHLWEMTEDDLGVRRLTQNALEQAPSGTSLDAAGVRAAVGLASANLDTQLGTIDGNVDSALADTNELQTNQGNWVTATGFSTHSAADVKTAIEAAGSKVTLILEDTGTTIPATLTTISGKVDTVDAVVDGIAADYSTFDPETDEVDLGKINGQTLTGDGTANNKFNVE